jgi:hypothetical protein
MSEQSTYPRKKSARAITDTTVLRPSNDTSLHCNSMPKSICPGCRREFTQTGLHSHLHQMRNPICRKTTEEQNALHAEDPQAINIDDTVQSLERSRLRNSDDDDIDMTQTYEDVVEDHTDQPGQSAGPDWDYDLDKDESEDGSVASEGDVVVQEVPDAEDILVDVFPGDAGTTVDPGSGTLYTQYNSTRYEEGNVYAPFRSQLDWEFARWAKLRGPGSTVVMELLQIAGVSTRAFLAACHLIVQIRSLSDWGSRIRMSVSSTS